MKNIKLYILNFKVIFLLLILITGLDLASQEKDSLLPISLNFYVTHPWKKVTGTCKDLKFDKTKVNVSGSTYTLSLPYKISCPLVNMKTGDSNRDSHMLEVLGYPNSREISIQFLKLKSQPEKKFILESEITIKSTTKNISINAVEDSNRPGKISGNFEVNLSDFSVERPALLFIQIDDRVRIDFQLEL